MLPAEAAAELLDDASPRALGEPLLRRLKRRIVTIPAVFLALLLVTAALPALVPAAILVDLLRPIGRRTLATLRLLAFLEAYLFVEALGLAMLAATGLATLGSPARREAWTFRVQRVYTDLHLRAITRLFSLRFVAEDAELAAQRGPVLVFVRHASIVDVLLPAAFLGNRHAIELRYVLKRDLLVDPCIDIAGHWIPNCFVARDGADSRREIEAVRALKTGLSAQGGVLVYPEGTRFTQQKRRRVLERLRDDPAERARAERLRHLLPIRPGGPLALLESEPACDVLFLGHHGLEGFATIRDIWAGALVGTTVRLKFWREPAAAIPLGREAQRAWLAERWQRLDDWLASIDAGEAPR